MTCFLSLPPHSTSSTCQGTPTALTLWTQWNRVGRRRLQYPVVQVLSDNMAHHVLQKMEHIYFQRCQFGLRSCGSNKKSWLYDVEPKRCIWKIKRKSSINCSHCDVRENLRIWWHIWRDFANNAMQMLHFCSCSQADYCPGCCFECYSRSITHKWAQPIFTKMHLGTGCQISLIGNFAPMESWENNLYCNLSLVLKSATCTTHHIFFIMIFHWSRDAYCPLFKKNFIQRLYSSTVIGIWWVDSSYKHG